MNVYIDTPFWYIRKNNTDWQYTISLKDIEKYSAIKTTYSRDWKLVLEENSEWLLKKLGAIKKTSLTRELSLGSNSNCTPDIIYSHGKLPLTEKAPTAWFFGVVDPEMRIKSGTSEFLIELEYKNLEVPFGKASAILFATKNSLIRHKERFPRLADKFHYAPFFLSHLPDEAPLTLLEKHQDQTDFLRLLFVGRDAYRKGLDIVISAYNKLPVEIRSRIKIDIVTAESANYPKGTYGNLIFHGELPRERISLLMKKAHCFIMPSRFETYGFVYLEAMSNGCAVISTHWESQNEIFDNGNCGLITTPNVKSVQESIIDVFNSTYRAELARSAILKYNSEYTPRAAADRHYSSLSRAIL